MRDSRGSAGKKPAKNSHAGASAGARIENLVRETAPETRNSRTLSAVIPVHSRKVWACENSQSMRVQPVRQKMTDLETHHNVTCNSS